MSTTRGQLDPEIQNLLDRLRRRIRLYVWLEGVAALVVVIGLAFWFGLLFDWLFEPPALVRSVALMVLGGILFWVLYRLILARAFARLPDSSMALLLEKHAGRFDDSLLTAVQLAELADREDKFSAEMLAYTNQQARSRVSEARLNSVFNFRPLTRKVAAAVLLLVSIGLFGYLASDALAFFVQERVIGLADARWPRNTRLIIDGFPPDAQGIRTMKIARGGSLDLPIKADNTMPVPPPQRVEVRYQLDDGSRGRGDARRIGEAAPGRDEYQEYIYSFKDVYHSHTFDVVGGDDRLTGLRLQVVDSPEIVAMTLHCEYPSYTNRGARELSVSGAMAIPRGTRITLRATANKDLEQVRIITTEANEPIVIDVPQDAVSRKQFEYEIPALNQDELLLFVLHDHDGIENQEPYRLLLSATPDEAPQVTVALRGIGTAITPSATIPLVGHVADDYGIARVWFEHSVNDTPPGTTASSATVAGQAEAALSERFNVETLRLEPQQKLVLAVKAADAYNLGEAPNEGSSQRFLLDVVTPDQLRSMLESRELMLRRRFETIYAEMTDTRDLMARIDFAATNDEPEMSEGEAAEGTLSAEEQASRALTRRQVRIVRSLQNIQRSAHETLAVATSFDDIHDELVNNRLDTEDLKTRLKDSISSPLKEIGGPMIKELETLLEKLNTQAADLEAGPETQRQALAQADAVLVEMKQVLDRMLELESYNEVMELLRAIIADQEKLKQQTDEKRKGKLRNLLED